MDEISLLTLQAAKKYTDEHGGGGGGNYNNLSNQPQIEGVTLVGNKTASDLGLQKELTAGDYVSITNNGTINVTKAIGVYDRVRYVFTPEGGGYYMRVEVYINDVKRFEQQYQNTAVFNHVVIMELVEFWYGGDGYYWHYKPLIDSREHAKDIVISWYYTEMDVHEETFDVPQDDSTTLATKGDIDAAISSAYHHAGTKTCAELVAGLLVAANEGNVYNMTDSGTTTADFIEGAGQPIKAGDNVGIAKISDGVYKFDLLSGFVDTTNFVQKSQTAGLLKNDGTVNDEIEGDVSSLKSGLTDLDNEVNGDATTYPYADVITIEDAVPANLADCSVKIEPVQDLHGYDKPWVGGAGKNKLPLTVDIVKSLNGGGTWTGNTYNFRDVDFIINTDNDGNVTSVKVNGTASQNVTLLLDFVGIASTEYYIGGCPANGGNNTYYFDTFGDGVARTADYGSGATFTADGNSQYVRIGVQQGYNAQNLMFYPMICLSSETDKSFAPYTNICPISGHTEVEVQRDGKNLIGEFENGGFDSNGLNGLSDKRVRSKYYVSVQEGQTYTFNANMNGGSGNAVASISLYTTDDYTTPRVDAVSFANCPVTFTVPNGIKYVRVLLKNSSDGNVTVSSFKDFQLEKGSTATPYEPYAGKTYTIALGDTIYGGTVDFDSGVMTVTHRYQDMSVKTYYIVAGTTDTFATNSALNGVKAPASNDNIANIICTDYKTVARNDQTDFSISVVTSGRAVVRDSRYDGYTPEDFQSAISGVYSCYELATPTTIQLTPQQIQLLKGTNTLTASTGQISVTVNGVSGAIGSLTSDKQDKTDYALETTEKTVVGAINELLARPSYIYNIEQSQSVSDLIGKFMVVGKICFFQLSATKTNVSYNLGVIRGISCLIEGVIAYDNVNDVPVHIINDPNTTATVFQIKSGATYTNPTVISGMFFLA